MNGHHNHSQHMVLSALKQLSNSREAKHYLKRYCDAGQAQFAVVKVGGGILANELDALARALALLANLGLRPIILHGAGVQVDLALKAAGVESVKRDGLRVTDVASMQVIRPTMYQVNAALVNALEQEGVRTTPLVHGVFECGYLDQAQYGLVGEVKKVHLTPIRQAVNSGSVPVLSCLGETPSGQVLNINADVATRELVWQLQPGKVIFVTPTGGVLDADDQMISSIDLNRSYQSLMTQPWLHSGMKLKLQQIMQMLEPMGPGHSVSITSCQNLTRELFTHKGAGTFINMGETIQVHDQLDDELEQQLSWLLEHSFKQQLKPGFLRQLPILKIYMAASGRAAALVTKGFRGQAYLHKFAVTPDARGEGLAGAVWNQMSQDHPELYWRSRRHNEINSWYFSKADCSVKSTDGQWVGFTCGLYPQEAMTCLHQAFAEDSGWQMVSETTREVSHG